MTQILSVNHLQKIFKNKVSDIELVDNDYIHFKCKYFDKVNLDKYNIYSRFISMFDFYLLVSEHPVLFTNINNILAKYKNAKNIMHIHKQEIDAKIKYYETMVWKKNGPKFKKEVQALDNSKFEVWEKYGKNVFILE